MTMNCGLLLELETCHRCIRAMTDYVTKLEEDKRRLEVELDNKRGGS